MSFCTVHTIKDIGVSAMLHLQPFKSNGFTLENMHTLKYVFFRFDVFVSFVIGKKILNFLSPKKNSDNGSSINNEREGIFKLDDKDIQDAEFEEINED